MSQNISFSVRKTSSNKAILFVHGFGGESHQTFGMLPAFLAGDNNLLGWDIQCFGYPTGLFPDITGVWSADPDLNVLSGYLSQAILSERYSQYTEVVLIAHSMGGLLVQQALLDSNVARRIRNVILFGTPSNGLQKALLGRIYKRQVRDMAYGSRFISNLRQTWAYKYPNQLPFGFKVVAGLKDEFVPTSSSIEIFDQQYRGYVQGNHLQMVKPMTSDDDIVLIIREALSSALPAGETSYDNPHLIKYYRTIEELGQKLGSGQVLLTKELVDYALALEMVGQQARAVELLEANHSGDTELTGTLAGRLKRKWLADPLRQGADGLRAYELYNQAFTRAKTLGDHCQAFYNGINVAFLELAIYHNRYNARQVAVGVLEHCRLALRDKWQLATEGEAHLYLGDPEYAIDCYEAALHSDPMPTPREIDSMYKQAIWSARLLENVEVEKSLEQLFAPFVTQ